MWRTVGGGATDGQPVDSKQRDLGGKYSATIKDIKSWWDPSYNDFANALSSIRKYFKREFDTTALKKITTIATVKS